MSVPGRIAQVRSAVSRGVSHRRASVLCQVARRMLRYQHRRPAHDLPLLPQLRELAVQHPRYGYRRIHALLRRQGQSVSLKRVHRLWRLAGLQRPPRSKRPRRTGTTPRPPRPTHLNGVWAVDFLYDHTAQGQTLKILTVVDEYSREAVAISVKPRMPSRDGQPVLTTVVHQRGQPTMVRSDNGREFLARTLHTWRTTHGIQPAPRDPGKPWQNGGNERFNGTLRDEWLKQEGWIAVQEAQVIIEQWRQAYNAERPHSSFGYRTPNEVRNLSQNVDYHLGS